MAEPIVDPVKHGLHIAYIHKIHDALQTGFLRRVPAPLGDHDAVTDGECLVNSGSLKQGIFIVMDVDDDLCLAHLLIQLIAEFLADDMEIVFFSDFVQILLPALNKRRAVKQNVVLLRVDVRLLPGLQLGAVDRQIVHFGGNHRVKAKIVDIDQRVVKNGIGILQDLKILVRQPAGIDGLLHLESDIDRGEMLVILRADDYVGDILIFLRLAQMHLAL